MKKYMILIIGLLILTSVIALDDFSARSSGVNEQMHYKMSIWGNEEQGKGYIKLWYDNGIQSHVKLDQIYRDENILRYKFNSHVTFRYEGKLIHNYYIGYAQAEIFDDYIMLEGYKIKRIR